MERAGDIQLLLDTFYSGRKQPLNKEVNFFDEDIQLNKEVNPAAYVQMNIEVNLKK